MRHSLFFMLLINIALILNNPAAASNRCAASQIKNLPANETVFFYQTTQRNKTHIIPILLMHNETLSGARTVNLPASMTLYNLENDEPITVQFVNKRDHVDYDLCRPIGISKDNAPINGRLFASKPLSGNFDFTPDKNSTIQYQTLLSKPCDNHQPQYDKNGVALCDADEIIATSALLNKKQIWHTKQYRHDVGFAVNQWNDRAGRFIEVADDCALCKD